MSNLDNLKPFKKGDLSKEELKKRQSNGGKKSVEVRREIRTFAMIFRELLNDKIDTSDGRKISAKQGIAIAQLRKALKGDTKSAEYIRDMIGEKPNDVKEITGSLGIKKVFVTEEEKEAVEEHIADVIGESR